MLLFNLTDYFNFLNDEAKPDCKLLDSFSDYIFFYPCNFSSFNNYIAYLEFLDCFYLKVVFSLSTLVIVTNISIISSRNMQVISTIYFWKLDYQVLSSKALASRTTAPNAELFAIRLGVSKVTSIVTT